MRKAFWLFTASLAAAAPIMAQVDYEDLASISSRFPPGGWTDVQIFSTSGWTTLDVTSASAVGSANVITPNNSSVDAAQKLEAIIASTSGNRILYFPAGTYYLKSHLRITSSNIFLQGAGIGQSRLTIATAAADNGEIEFAGAGLGGERDVTNLPARGDTSISAGSTSGISVGDVIHIYEKSLGPALSTYTYGQLAQVTSVSGSTIGISPALGLSYISDPKFAEVSVIRNVGIRGFSVYRDRAAASDNTNNIEFAYVKNGYAREVESSWLERGGVLSYYSMDIVMITSFAHDAYDYGGGGQAYGFSLANLTTRSRVTDNKAWNLRHHFIASLGANNSIFSLNSAEPGYLGATGDLSIHGFSPHNLLFEQNQGRDLKADGRSDLNGEQYSGLWNVFYRNNLVQQSSSRLLLEAPVTAGNFPHHHPTVIGNDSQSLSIASSTVDRWVGANRVGGTVVLGNAPSGWTYPASLYNTTKPGYFGTKPWPIFGPGLSVGGTFGNANTLPSKDRAKP